MNKNDSRRARISLRLALCLAVLALSLGGCKSTPTVDSSVTSVSEEGGIRFTRITEDNDGLSVTEIAQTSGRRIPIVQKVFDVSRDGGKVAYLATRDKKTNVYVKNLATGARGTLQRTFRDNVMDVSMSPDGRLLAFSDRREGNLNVYLTNADSGSAIRQVTSSPLDERYPAFSTDGRSLLYVQNEFSGKEASKTNPNQQYMWVYDIARGTQTQYAEGYNGEFSPDSRKVVFTRNNKETQARELWMMELDNGQEILIASEKNRNFMDPVLSPDGSKISFTSASRDKDEGSDRNLDIYVINSDGSKLTQITFHPGDDMYPRWGPDGKSIYFLSQRGSPEKKWNIWRMDLRLDSLQ